MRLLFLLSLFLSVETFAQEPVPVFTWCKSQYHYDVAGRLSEITIDTSRYLTAVSLTHYFYAGNKKVPDSIVFYTKNRLRYEVDAMMYDKSDSLLTKRSIMLLDFSDYPPGSLPDLNPTDDKKKPKKLYPVAKEKPDTIDYFCARDAHGFISRDSSFTSLSRKWSFGIYSYSANRLVEEDFRLEENDEWVYLYTYYENGMLAEQDVFRQDNGNRTPESQKSWYYDEHNRISHVSCRYSDIELPPRVLVYHYSKRGMQLKIRSGSMGSRRTWRYETFEFSSPGIIRSHSFWEEVP